MSITPLKNITTIQLQSGVINSEIFKNKKKLFKLSPISNNLQQKRPPKISICDNKLFENNEKIVIDQNKPSQSINQFITSSGKDYLFSNSSGIKQQIKNKLVIQKNVQSSQKIGKNEIFQRSENTILKQNSSSSDNSLKSQSYHTNNQILTLKDMREQNKNNNQINDQKMQGLTNINEEKQFFSFSQLLALLRNKIRILLESIPFQIFITILTIFSLFMEDFRAIFVQESHDHIIDYVNIFFLGSFFIQILMSLTIENYAFSFFFYLDVISTLSITMDITLITDIIYDSGGSAQQLNFLVTQSKASRAAARAVRIMKIFRLARVVKLYKSAIKAKQINEQKQKQLLKAKIKAKKYNVKQSGLMNENFEGQSSQYKLSFTNNLSAKEKSVVCQSEKSEMGIPALKKKGSNKNDTSKITKKQLAWQNIEMIDRIHEQPVDEEGSYNNSEVIKDPGNQSQKQVECENQQQNAQKASEFVNPLEMGKQQSNISKILSDSTIKKIIIVILIIMFSMTALDNNVYYPENTSWDFLASYVAKLLLQPNVPIQHINQIILKKIQFFKTLDINSEIIAFKTPFNQIYSIQTKDYSQLRITQIGLAEKDIDIVQILKVRPYLTLDTEYTLSQNTTSLFDSITIILSYQSFNQIDSWFSMAKIIFICLTIVYLLQSFNTNISDLIVTPIQKMLQIVINPDKKLQVDQQQQNANDFKEARYQTLIVQKAIVKIRGLMSTIFGKIGMQLIYSQLFKSQNINATNYLSVNRKSFCIYGICRIQNFIQIAQTLQNDTFTFVNQIAKIVHSAVYRYGGYGVKNLNDGFLVVFKIPEEKQKQILEQMMKSKISKQKQNTYLNVLCDFSIFSMIKMIVRLHKEPNILKYKKDQRILYKFGNNFQTEMNFSIGIGQSFEGIVGSQFKIDPIYLGGKLDEINKISQISPKYPNLIIIQKQLYQNLTIGLKSHCRIIDYVNVNDYDEGKTQIYGVDLELQYISPSRSKAEKYKKKEQQTDINFKKQVNMLHLRDSTQINNYYAQEFINSKKELRQVLKKKMSDEMKKKYQTAFNSYITGDWIEAKQSFEEIMRVVKQDVLSKRIFNFMAQRGFKFNQNTQNYKYIHQI